MSLQSSRGAARIALWLRGRYAHGGNTASGTSPLDQASFRVLRPIANPFQVRHKHFLTKLVMSAREHRDGEAGLSPAAGRWGHAGDMLGKGQLSAPCARVTPDTQSHGPRASTPFSAMETNEIKIKNGTVSHVWPSDDDGGKLREDLTLRIGGWRSRHRHSCARRTHAGLGPACPTGWGFSVTFLSLTPPLLCLSAAPVSQDIPGH